MEESRKNRESWEMDLSFHDLKPSDLAGKKTASLREPSSTRPALYRIEEGHFRAVVKDYSVNRWAFRNLIGRFLVWREKKAYGRLKGMQGVPALYGVVGGLALVLEEIRGRSMEGLEKQERLPALFFDDLREVVEAVHRRGLCHCDLKRAANVLVGDDGRPYLVDWSAAILEKELGFFPVRLIYRRFLLDDRQAAIKFQLRHCPEAIAPEDLQRYQNRSVMEKAVRNLRDRARRFLQRVA